jgi:beta-lactamase class D
MRRFLLGLVLWLVPASALAQAMEVAPELASHLQRHGVAGVVALYDPASGRLRVSDRREAEAGSRPASTFKVAAALIALDAGVVKDADKDVFVYDWEPFIVPACNADQTLASALPRSCVPVFAKLGRMIGDVRLASGLKSFGFGNAAASGDYPYWLRGDLRISALQQIAFMDRLRREDLPVSAATMRTVTRIIELQRSGDFVLRGKTGWHINPPPAVGWLVGWAEKGEAVRVFAVRIEAGKGVDPAARLAVVLSALAAEGLAP